MQDKLRIETAINKAAYKSHPLGFKDSVSVDWAEEAIIEERDKAIDECIALVGNQPTIDACRWPEVKRKLEALKSQ